MKTKARKTLANVKKLSTLLAIGLRDLRKQERARNSEVDMSACLVFNGRCVACLGGSVMRFSLGMRRTAWFDAFDYQTALRLSALDYLRRGYVLRACSALGRKRRVPDHYVTRYELDRKRWWSDMRQLLADLRAAGE